jgi:hypothetical protein
MYSGGTPVYPPVPEESEEPYTAPMEKTSYLDPYAQNDNDRLVASPSAISTRSGHGGKLANMFHFSTSADPSKHHEVRGGGHRGTKDYPHLRTRDFATEQQERAGLVDSDAADEDSGRPSFEDEPRSAITDESMGHVLLAERRPAPAEVDRPPIIHEEDERMGAKRGSPRGPRQQL